MGKNRMDDANGFFSIDILLSAGISVLTSAILALAAGTDMFRVFGIALIERQGLNRYVPGLSVGIPAPVLGQ